VSAEFAAALWNLEYRLIIKYDSMVPRNGYPAITCTDQWSTIHTLGVAISHAHGYRCLAILRLRHPLRLAVDNEVSRISGNICFKAPCCIGMA
jgi:hypothetical protein